MFQLPSAWFVAVLSEWLDMPSIGVLDTAISSEMHRLQFLVNLQNMRSTSADSFSDDRSHVLARGWTGRWWRWLSIRQVYVERIVLRGNAVGSDLVIPSMRKAVAESFGDDDLQCLVRNCPSLRSLSLTSYSDRMSQTGLSTLSTLTNLHQCLEEFSFRRGSGYDQPEAFYTETGAALIDALRRCSRLQKVALTGDALRAVNLEDLLPYGHLFHELEFQSYGRTAADAQAISNLLVNCGNLRKLHYQGSDDEHDLLFFTPLSCPLLEVLELSSFSFNQQQQIAGAGASAAAVAAAGVFTLIHRNCKHLRELTLRRSELSASTLPSIGGMESLKELTLDECEGVTAAGMAVLATMKLVKLGVYVEGQDDEDGVLTAASLVSFVGSNISQTLEKFELSVYDFTVPIDDVQVATALASCHNLKKLSVNFGDGGCLFGRNGLDGLQALATGCPLLADVSLYLTLPGLHYLGTHFANLEECTVYCRRVVGAPTPEGFPSIDNLQTLYPAVMWIYFEWELGWD